MPSKRTEIATALKNKIQEITQIKLVTIDDVRIKLDDFKSFELPAVQLIDENENNIHENRKGKKTWRFSIELIMLSDENNVVTQTELWDLMETIENKLFEVPNLGVPGVLHIMLDGSETDLHLVKPYYLGKIDITIVYYQNLLGAC